MISSVTDKLINSQLNGVLNFFLDNQYSLYYVLENSKVSENYINRYLGVIINNFLTAMPFISMHSHKIPLSSNKIFGNFLDRDKSDVNSFL